MLTGKARRSLYALTMNPSRCSLYIKLASGIKLAIPVSRSVLNLHPAADPRNRFLDVHATPTHPIYRHTIPLYVLGCYSGMVQKVSTGSSGSALQVPTQV